MTQKETAASGQDISMAKTAAHEEPALLLEPDVPSFCRDRPGVAAQVRGFTAFTGNFPLTFGVHD